MIRPAREEDAAALVALDLAVLRDGRGVVRGPDELPTVDAMAGRIRDHLRGTRSGEQGGMWVAEQDGVVVGEGTVHRLAPSLVAHVALVALQVHPGAQRQGHGRALLRTLLDWCDARVHRVELYVRGDNHRAIALYASEGFVLEGRRVDFVRLPDGTFVDDLVMGRIRRP